MGEPSAAMGGANLNSYGSTGGYTPGEGAGGGMGAMGYASLAAMLGGGVLDYMGQRKGAKAMEAEARRQAAEQDAFNQQKHQLLLDQLATIDPSAQTALATGGILRSQAATAPALAAGGKALGLSGDAVRSVGRSMLPMQRVQANRGAGAQLDTRRGNDAAALIGNTQGIQDRQDSAGALYDMRSQIASNEGAGLRMGAELLKGGGMAGLSYAMAQPGRTGSQGTSGDPRSAPSPSAPSMVDPGYEPQLGNLGASPVGYTIADMNNAGRNPALFRVPPRPSRYQPQQQMW